MHTLPLFVSIQTIESLQECLICSALSPSDVFCYYTSCGWMMFNFNLWAFYWLSTLALYDGSVKVIALE